MRSSAFVFVLAGCVGGSSSLECPPGMTARDGGCVVGFDDAGPGSEADAASSDALTGADTGPSGGEDAGSGVDALVDAGSEWSVRIDPRQLHFGVVNVGAQRERSLLVINDGQVASTVVLTALSGPDSAAFESLELEVGGSRTLAPGESFAIPLRFTAGRVGRHEAELVLDLCDGGCYRSVLLRGDGVEEGTQFVCQSQVTLVMDAGGCTTETLFCFNAGSEPVDVLELSAPYSGTELDWSIVPISLPATVAPGDAFLFELHACTIAVPGRGSGGTVDVTVDDEPGGRIIRIPVDFEALDVRDGCRLLHRDWRVNFGRVVVGETVIRSLPLSADSSGIGTTPAAACEIDPSLDPANAGFTVLTSPYVLQPGDVGQVDVAFSPLVEGWAEVRLQLNPAYAIDLVGYGSTDPRPGEHLVESRTEDFAWVGTGDELPWVGGKDDGYAQVPIPFAFEFLGAPVTEAWVSANGFISFEALPPSTVVNSDFPDAPAPNTSVAWWWDDLIIDGSTIQWVDGVAPDQVLHIQLNGVVHVLGSMFYSVELRLFEGSNVIELHFSGHSYPVGDLPPPLNGAFSSSSGWEGPTGAVGQDILGCTPSCHDWDWPANVVYRFTPL